MVTVLIDRLRIFLRRVGFNETPPPLRVEMRQIDSGLAVVVVM